MLLRLWVVGNSQDTSDGSPPDLTRPVERNRAARTLFVEPEVAAGASLVRSSREGWGPRRQQRNARI
jgi:hypothetical protein